MNFRKARKEDIDQLSVLFKHVYIETYGIEGVSMEFTNFMNKQFSRDKIKADIEKENIEIFVATFKNNLVGVLQVEYEKACPIKSLVATEINKLYILRQFYGRGIGQELMKLAEQHIAERNFRKIWLWVLDSNERAIQFYRQQGYEDLGFADFQMEVNIYRNLVMIKKL